MKKIIIGIFATLFALAGAVIVAILLLTPKQKTYYTRSLPDDTIALEQNWDADVRQQIHYMSFGSRLMPYDLFVNLELADDEVLLTDASVMDRLGFINQNPASNNPRGLPVGFALDESRRGDWVGLSCTSCHTGMITYEGRKILIEGGPGLLDFNQFESVVYRALEAALNRQDKFDRLVQRMQLRNSQEVAVLRSTLSERVAFFANRLDINRVSVPYGHGRLDAFGRIFNAVTATALNMPGNHHEPNAPVSIPMLWDASHLDLVQWNASAPNKNPGPLGQNVTTALAVYGQIDLTPGKFSYRSSVNIANLGYIQSRYYRLESPRWPEKILGKLDAARVATGELLYRDNCLECHALIDRSAKNRLLSAKLVPVDEVQTDQQMAKNFATLHSATGPLAGKRQAIIGGKRFGEQAQTIDIVVNAAVGAILHKPFATLSAFFAENNVVKKAELDFSRQVYKARALNGVWATGPFLHNGSVPTLFDLLQEPDNRPREFFVGSREFDPLKVGLVQTKTPHSSYFDTRLRGNSNRGHVFGTRLSEEQKWALIEYIKSL